MITVSDPIAQAGNEFAAITVHVAPGAATTTEYYVDLPVGATWADGAPATPARRLTDPSLAATPSTMVLAGTTGWSPGIVAPAWPPGWTGTLTVSDAPAPFTGGGFGFATVTLSI